MLLLSRSEGAWVGALLSPVIYWLFFRPAQKRRPRLTLLLCAGAALGVVGLGAFLLATKSAEQLDTLSDGRYYLLRAGLNMLRQSPFVGVGLGNFYQDLGSFYPPGIVGRKEHEQAHSMYLQLLTELGPLGLVTFAIPFVKLFARAVRVPALDAMTRAFLLGVLAVLLHSFTDYTLWIAVVSLAFWMCLGVLTVLIEDSGKGAPRPQPGHLSRSRGHTPVVNLSRE